MLMMTTGPQPPRKSWEPENFSIHRAPNGSKNTPLRNADSTFHNPAIIKATAGAVGFPGAAPNGGGVPAMVSTAVLTWLAC